MAKNGKAKFRRHPNQVSKLLDLIVALNERRKYLEQRIAAREIMLETGVNVIAAEDLLRRRQWAEERAYIEQTGI